MTIQNKISENEKFLSDLYVEREDIVHGVPLALYSNSNILLLGPPGTAKSALVKAWAAAFKGKYFERLLTKFSTPDELFGPISAKGLDEDDYRRITEGKLPESDFAFLDEVFKANSGILNSLLGVMNERTYPNGKNSDPNIPLKLLVGASNETPAEDDGLDAMYDRFHFKYKAGYINDTSEFAKALTNDYSQKIPHFISQEDVRKGMKDAAKVTYDDGIINLLIGVKRNLEKKTIVVTDRTWVKAIQIMKTEAYLQGRKRIEEADFEVLKNVLWSKPEDERVVHLSVLTVTMPEKAKIVDIYERSVDLYKEFKKSKKDVEKSTLGIDTMHKITASIQEVEVMLKNLNERGKVLDSLYTYRDKLHRMNQEIVKDATGIDLPTVSKELQL